MEDGKILSDLPTPMDAQDFLHQRMSVLPDETKDLDDPRVYQTVLSGDLFEKMKKEIKKQKDIHL